MPSEQASNSGNASPLASSTTTSISMSTSMPTTTAAAPPVAKEKKAESSLKSFLAGGVGGVCVVLTGHPLDLIKVRIQTAGASAESASVLGMLTRTMANEGIRGLYRGVSAPLLAVTPMFAVSFWGYDVGQQIVRYVEKVPNDVTALSLRQNCIAGAISAFPTTVLMAPSERIKCLLQTSPPGQYRGTVDCAWNVLKTGGIVSLYRGTLLTLMRDVPGSIAWFGTYEFVKASLMRMQGGDGQNNKKLSPLAVLTAGGLAGMACWSVSIPADVLKSRYQSAPDGTYRGILHVYQDLMEKEGPAALIKGIRPALIRAFPANAACFFGMEVARKVLGLIMD